MFTVFDVQMENIPKFVLIAISFSHTHTHIHTRPLSQMQAYID